MLSNWWIRRTCYYIETTGEAMLEEIIEPKVDTYYPKLNPDLRKKPQSVKRLWREWYNHHLLSSINIQPTPPHPRIHHTTYKTSARILMRDKEVAESTDPITTG